MSMKHVFVVASFASSIAASTQAGLLTMTANNASGVDAWNGLSGYRMSLTIDCGTLDTAGSASSFNLNTWLFEAFDMTNTLVFRAAGSGGDLSISGGDGSNWQALIVLSDTNIQVNNLDPKADYIAFSYTFATNDSLGQAIANSAAPSGNGSLALGTDVNGGGDLSGGYVIPTPGAVALLATAAGLAGRRRRG